MLIYHISIDKQSFDTNFDSIIRGIDRQDDTKVYYYTDTINISKDFINNKVRFLEGHFGSVEYGGINRYTNNKANSVILNYISNVLKHRDDTHIIMNLVTDVCYYTKILNKLFGVDISVDISYSVKDTYLNKLTHIVDIGEINHILKVYKRYKKVVFIDADSIVLSNTGTITNLIGDKDTLYISVGLNGYLQEGMKFTPRKETLSLKYKIDMDLLIELEDRFLSVNINIGNGVNLIPELTDMVINLLGVYLGECNKKVMVLSMDKYYTNINKLACRRIISTYYNFINNMFLEKSSLDVLNIQKVDRDAITNIGVEDRKLLIREFNTWGLDGVNIYNDLMLLNNKINSLGLKLF